eukprot:TRINITY_DN14864_c2_g2_i1.p1 TRINITY_DN14864_c2_g2~~TRINITY_DN14864_c2_g2_i1.p1  ORF type:complete len:269 (+),score=76.43 TRINITY_DN14864_c2_g2_i1:75-881(+)
MNFNMDGFDGFFDGLGNMPNWHDAFEQWPGGMHDNPFDMPFGASVAQHQQHQQQQQQRQRETQQQQHQQPGMGGWPFLFQQQQQPQQPAHHHHGGGAPHQQQGGGAPNQHHHHPQAHRAAAASPRRDRRPRLDKVKLTADEVANLGDCAICLDVLQEGADAYLTPCYHMFHVACLESWWKRDVKCPLCMAESLTGQGGDGRRLRERKQREWREERVGNMRRKRLGDMTNREVKQRLQELGVSTAGVLERQELLELLVCHDPHMGTRVS